jgi:phosphoenolpyruvate phosphomutase
MPKSASLRASLSAPQITRIAGAHSPLGAALAQETGFDAVWASGLEISASRCVPDANILSMAECLESAALMDGAIGLPVLADCDSGFGGVGNVVHMVQSYERRGIAGVCIEDKVFPKLNSFIGTGQDLIAAGDFAARITAAAEARRSPDFVIVARIEALIAGAGMAEALHRARLYELAGADALLIHSKNRTPAEIFEFRDKYQGPLPVLVVPTTYPEVTAAELGARGIGGVIYANQSLRGAIAAMRDVLARIASAGSSAPVEASIASLKEVFALQGMDDLLACQDRHTRLTADYETRV